MVPSSIKKMSHRRWRIEGNYASTDSSQSSDLSLNTDLGLTLFPGSQTRKENERSKVAAIQALRRELIVSRTCVHVLELRSLHRLDIPLPITRNIEDVELRSRWRNGYCLLRNGRRRKIEGREACHPAKANSNDGCEIATLYKPETIQYHLESGGGDCCIEIPRETGEVPVDEQLLGQMKQSRILLKECSSDSGSALGSGFLSPKSCHGPTFHLDLSIPPSRQSIQVPAQSTNIVVKSISSCEKDPVNVGLGLKLSSGLEHTRAFNPAIIDLSSSDLNHVSQEHDDNHTRAKIAINTRQRASKLKSRVLRSWTCHIPKNAKRRGKDNNARRSALLWTQNPSLFSTTLSVTFQKHRQLSFFKRILPSLLDRTSSTSEEPVISLIDRASANSTETRPVVCLQHSTHRLSHSLPTLSSIGRVLNMDTISYHEPWMPPTPPHENQSHNSQYLSSGSTTNRINNDFLMTSSANPNSPALNASTPSSSLAHQDANARHNFHTLGEKSSNSAEDGAYHPNVNSFSEPYIGGPACGNRFQTLTSQPFEGHAGYHRVITSASQRYSSQSINVDMETPITYAFQGQPGYNNAVTPVPNRANNPVTSQRPHTNLADRQGSNKPEATLSEYIRIIGSHGNRIKMLEHMLNEKREWCDNLAQTNRYYETSMASKRLVYLEHERIHTQRRIAALQHENTELKAKNQCLNSENQKLVGKLRPDVAIANDMLQGSGPSSTGGGSSQVGNNTKISMQSSRSTSWAFRTSPSKIGQTCPAANQNEQEPPNAAFSSLSDSCNGVPGPGAAESPIDPTTASLTNNNPETRTSDYCGDPSVNQSLGPASIDDIPNTAGDGSSKAITIDLTNDSMQSSDAHDASPPFAKGTFSQPQRLPALSADIPQAQLEFCNEFSKKNLLWLKGHHPGRITRDYGANFGSCSSMRLPNATVANGGTTTQETQVFGNEAKKGGTQKEQAQKEHLAKRPLKQAAYSERKNETRESNKAINQQAGQNTQTSGSVPNRGKKARKSAKVQKRQQQSQKSPNQDQPKITENRPDGGLRENGAELQQLAYTDIEMKSSEMDLDSLFEDEMDVSQNAAMHVFDDAREAMDTTEADHDAEIAAILEAELTAEVENEHNSNDQVVEMGSNYGQSEHEHVDTLADGPVSYENAGSEGSEESEEE